MRLRSFSSIETTFQWRNDWHHNITYNQNRTDFHRWIRRWKIEQETWIRRRLPDSNTGKLERSIFSLHRRLFLFGVRLSFPQWMNQLTFDRWQVSVGIHGTTSAPTKRLNENFAGASSLCDRVATAQLRVPARGAGTQRLIHLARDSQ